MPKPRLLTYKTGGIVVKNLSMGTVIWWSLAIISLITNIFLTVRVVKAVPEIEAATVVENAQILPENDGKLVVVTGAVTMEEDVVTDPLFGISVPSPILIRQVQMYQWVEYRETEEVKRNGEWVEETIFSYGKTWSEALVNHKNFRYTSGHTNPDKMPLDGAVFMGTASLGDFALTPEQMKILESDATVTVRDLSDEFANRYGFAINVPYYTTVASDAKPAVGDVRIAFYYIDPPKLNRVSVFAKQTGHTFDSYRCEGGEVIYELQFGTVSKEDFLAGQAEKNKGALIFIWCWFALCSTVGTVLFFLNKPSSPKVV